jgi:membrane protein DedA with SNARE-associated domain
MKYVLIGVSVSAALIVLAIVAAAGYSALKVAASDPQWQWVIPVVVVAVLVGVIAGSVEYLTDRRPEKTEEQ